MSYLPASLISVKKNGIKLGAATECSVSVQSDLTEVAGTQQGTASEYVSGKLSWSVSAKQLLPNGNTATDHYGSLQRGDLIEVAVQVGGMTLTGNGYVTSVKTTHDVKNAASVSIKVSGSGPLVPSGKTGLFYDAPVVTATVTAPTIPAAGGTGNISVNITRCTQHWSKWLYGSIIEQGDIINDGKDARFMCSLGTHDNGVSLSGTAISAPGLGDTPQATHVCAVVSYRFYVNGSVSAAKSLNVYQLANDGSAVYHPAELIDVPGNTLPSVAGSGVITLRNGYTSTKLASGEEITIQDSVWSARSNVSWFSISYDKTVNGISYYNYSIGAQGSSGTIRSAIITFSHGSYSTSCTITQSPYNQLLPIRFYVDSSLFASGQTVKASVNYTEGGVNRTHLLSARITAADSQLYFPVSGKDPKDIAITLHWIKVESSADALGDVSLEIDSISEDYEPKGAQTTILYPKSSAVNGAFFLADKVKVRVGAGVAAYRAPYIDETTGNWMIWDPEQGKFVDTGRSSKGDNGYSPQVGENGNWWEWDDTQKKYTDTGKRAQGKDAFSPYVGSNGNWYLWDDTLQRYKDSGRTSRGDDGNAPYINKSDGYWYEYNAKTKEYECTYIKAKGENGTSVLAQYSANGSSSWHYDFRSTDKYMRTSADGGSNWSDPMRIVGEDGNNGDYTEFSFAISAYKTTSGSDTCPGDISPGEWNDGPVSTTTSYPYLWMRRRKMVWNGTSYVAGTAYYQRVTGEKGEQGDPGDPGEPGKTPYQADVASSVPHFVYTSESNYDNPSSYYKVVGFYAISGSTIRVKVKNLYSEEITLPCDFYTKSTSGQYGPHLGFTLTIPAGTESYYTTTTDSGYFPQTPNLLSKILVWRTK